MVGNRPQSECNEQQKVPNEETIVYYVCDDNNNSVPGGTLWKKPFAAVELKNISKPFKT